jgi:MoaA/NifB/PqqE/SkfB family radical SAM enzyme
MIEYKEIKTLHIELSSFCNARCPLCPRNLRGYPYNLGYNETNLRLELIQQKLSPKFIKQLEIIYINGNFGDFVMNPESIDILEYFRQENPTLKIKISTNGSARDKEFWQELSKLKCQIYFCLDGLDDTHALYRQDTQWNKIINNANHFIEQGGHAIWKMVLFDHNKHQVELCEQMSKDLGFKKFELVDHGRNAGLVFDRQGNLSHVIGDYPTKTNHINDIINSIDSNIFQSLHNRIDRDTTVKPNCKTMTNKTGVFISSDAKVYPCCWTGFNPLKYRYNGMAKSNLQIKSIMKNNDLNQNTFEECVEWFKSVEESWNQTDYKKGRLIACDLHCGHCTTK